MPATRIGDRLVAEVGRQESQNARCHRSPEVPSNGGTVTLIGTSTMPPSGADVGGADVCGHRAQSRRSMRVRPRVDGRD